MLQPHLVYFLPQLIISHLSKEPYYFYYKIGMLNVLTALGPSQLIESRNIMYVY